MGFTEETSTKPITKLIDLIFVDVFSAEAHSFGPNTTECKKL
jgi:hypothetical protein